MFTIRPVLPGHIVMSQWNIVVVTIDTGQVVEKFLGLDDATGRYRFSTEVLSYDVETGIGQTYSGSQYRFIDKPGRLHPKAQQVLDYLNRQDNITAVLKFPTDH